MMAKMTIYCKGCRGGHRVNAQNLKQKFPLSIYKPKSEQDEAEMQQGGGGLAALLQRRQRSPIGYLCVKCSKKQEVANRPKGTGWRAAFNKMIDEMIKEKKAAKNEK